MIGEINRHGVANHLISIVYIRIDKFEVIGEALDTCHFPYSHSSIEVFNSMNKLLFIRADFSTSLEPADEVGIVFRLLEQ